jgi:3-carboxy-cis,cis-muconate cycloisomerase
MSLAEQIAATPAMRAIFSPRASVQAMLDVEGALAKAGAAVGLVPADTALAIAAACSAEATDLETLYDDAARAGTVVIPLVKWLKAAVPDHAAYVHVGSTSQDIIDTGLVLQLMRALPLLLGDMALMADGAAQLAQAHAATPMAGRTLLQTALPVTFGLKAAYWLTAIEDSRRAIIHAASEALVLQCGGAAGTLDAVAGFAAEFTAALGADLGLSVPVMPWHTSRAPLLRLAAAITGAVGVAGKIGTDIALMMQPELAELSEPAAPGRGGSSAMAHKRNPTLAITARAAATRMPGYLATLAAAQMQEHERAAGTWQAEAPIWPSLMLCASGGIAAMAEALPGLIVNAEAMRHNLGHLPDAHAAPGAAAALISAAISDYQTC